MNKTERKYRNLIKEKRKKLYIYIYSYMYSIQYMYMWGGESKSLEVKIKREMGEREKWEKVHGYSYQKEVLMSTGGI